MKARTANIFIFILFAVALACMLVFSIPDLTLTSDKTANALWLEIIPRLIAGACMTAAIIFLRIRIVRPISKNIFRSLLWVLPCFLVVLANFPFTALISGGATIERTDLIWLFLLKCFAVGLFEETFFRGILLTVILERTEGKNQGMIIAILISSAVFGLWHLLNLFYGASIGATLMQIGYSFLIGCMLAIVLIKTANIWLCVIIHALFNFGGGIVPALGSGAFQDTYFWIFTIMAAPAVAAFLILFIIETKTCYAYKQIN